MCRGLRWRGPGRIADVFGASAADGPRSGPVRIRIVAGRDVPFVSRALFCVFPVPGGASLVRGCGMGGREGRCAGIRQGGGAVRTIREMRTERPSGKLHGELRIRRDPRKRCERKGRVSETRRTSLPALQSCLRDLNS